MPLSLHFDHGVMTLSTFDPLSNQYETRTLRLPDPPSLESLEHIFTPVQRDNDHTTGSFRQPKCKPVNKAPRRCYSTPSLARKKDFSNQGEALKMRHSRRSLLSKRGIFQSLVKRISSRRSERYWSGQTRFMEMRPSTEVPFQYRKEAGNWWAASPAASTLCVA